jgi:hypothetical protein
MPYLPLTNFKYDSGPNRIQSGPDHEGYVVLYSGVQSTGPDNGIVVGGAPLSGTLVNGAWDYDSNWRYVPSTLPSQSGVLNPAPYNASGALDTYDATRIYTRSTVAGAQASNAIGPETGKITPRGGALQANSNVGRPEAYMYYGGGAPDNQDYSPYNTPDANTAAEGKTGGGVTHRTYESSLLTNVLGSQGTSDRSQWRYHQPVYCKTYTETQRSTTPGLMSSPLRYIYRGNSTSYSSNYGAEVLSNSGGFKLLVDNYPPSELTPGSGTLNFSTPVYIDNIITVTPTCVGARITWYRVDTVTGDRTLVSQGSSSYTVVMEDEDFYISADVECPEPFVEGGYGPAGTAGTTTIVSFNPYEYRYARFTGRWYSPTTASFTRTTSWVQILNPANPDPRYLFVLGDAGNCSNPSFPTIPCQQLIKWGNNITLELGPTPIGWCKNSPRNLTLYRATEDLSFIDFFFPLAVGIQANTCTPPNTTTFFAAMSGVYQFSNNQSTILRTWNGRQASF